MKFCFSINSIESSININFNCVKINLKHHADVVIIVLLVVVIVMMMMMMMMMVKLFW